MKGKEGEIVFLFLLPISQLTMFSLMPRQRKKTQNTAAQEAGENSMIK